MTKVAAAVAVMLVTVHGPGDQKIEINPDQISSMRKALKKNEVYLHGETQCVLTMTNGKLISTTETCEQVEGKITEELEHRRLPP